MFDLKSTYLNTAYQGPMPLLSRQRVEKILDRCVDPSFLAFDEWYPMADKIRGRLARLMNCSADSFAISTSVSELFGHIANGLDLRTNDEVLILEGDFPSLVLPWMVLHENKKFELRKLPLSTFQDPYKFKKELSNHTRMVCCSHVLFNSGQMIPIAELGSICKGQGILLASDVTQSFGAMPLSQDIVQHVDILVCAAYKWLLGPYGSAVGYFSETALSHIKRTHASWSASPNSQSTENLLNYTTDVLPGARKFDRGQTQSFLMMAALDGALEVIEGQGLHEIYEHNQDLNNYFLSKLPMTYTRLHTPGSSLICIAPPDGNATALKKRLAENNIDVSVREGSLRISFHFFNTKEEADKALMLL